MTCNHGIALIVFFAALVVVGAIPYHILFKSYCARIAELEGRMDELYSLKAPEGGMNWFEIEQSGKLWSRYYLKFDDVILTALGNRLFKWGGLGLFIIISLLAAMIFVKATLCSD